ncbi:hypothetical protein DFH08DRAFT_961925 [Mycena albidolilacea]|uniref:Uncharacterized protein n=1 Tax=Mycena albidolilacea TaxID=1033008 RepID=A0AAD7EPB4_9AGAR|nr:hypothetical protein DFH08DRAFT_961925 [Mycena albidolilacea]
MRRSLQRDQTITATHDNAAAWAGIGAAAFMAWCQKAVPASILGVLSTFLYLSGVLVLHITTPALFSLETVNASRPLVVPTQGLPSYNWSKIENGLLSDFQTLEAFLPQPLSLLSSVFERYIPTVGLQNGTLYEILAPNKGAGNVTVNATTFDITCGYLEDVNFSRVENTTNEAWNLTAPAFAPYYAIIYPTQPGLIVPINRTYIDAVLFYSTIPILDSSGIPGEGHVLAPPLYNATSAIEIFGCTQTLVNQTATVDSQSRTIQTLGPQKTYSTWAPYTGPLNALGGGNSNFTFDPTRNMFLDLWGLWYNLIPPSDFPLVPQAEQKLSVADLQLNQMLNLVSSTDRPQNVTLHALENALSTLVAAMFWTSANAPPSHGFIIGLQIDGHSVTTISDTLPSQISGNANLSLYFQRPFLLPGNATVTVNFAEPRLDLSIIALTAGFTVSIALLILSLPSSLPVCYRRPGVEPSIEGTGILHSIWLYRNHRELEGLLEQVDDPTR